MSPKMNRCMAGSGYFSKQACEWFTRLWQQFSLTTSTSAYEWMIKWHQRIRDVCRRRSARQSLRTKSASIMQ